MENEIYVFVLEMYGEVLGRKEGTLELKIKQPRSLRIDKASNAPAIMQLLGKPEELHISEGLKFYWVCKDEQLCAAYIKAVSGIFTAKLVMEK